METAQIKFKTQNGKFIPYVEGDFKFQASDTTVLEKDLIPKKDITFSWSVEMQQDVSGLYGDEELYEMMAEKLKQDFIKFLHHG